MTADPPTGALILAETPERLRWRELNRTVEQHRDELATLELELHELRDELSDFEAQLGLALAAERRDLDRVERVTRGLEQWAELIRRAAELNLVDAAREHERRRQRRRRRRRRARRHAAQPELCEAPNADLGAQLKRLFHFLARRYHPDLAGDEAERIHHGRIMARVNALYRAGDLARLEALAAEAPADADEPIELPVAVARLETRLAAIQLGLENLRQEREQLCRSPTGELCARARAATTAGEDLFAVLRAEMRARLSQSHLDVAFLVTTLEAEVQRHNRRHAAEIASPRGDRSPVFDPLAERRLVRLSREALDARAASPAARALSRHLQEAHSDQPALLHLLLFTYVAELSPFPLGGIDSFAELERRYLAIAGEAAPPLAEALIGLEEWIEFGVRRATGRVVHAGLRFRHADAQTATALALGGAAFRQALKRVLGVIGERLPCPPCGTEVYAVPLFRTRGLDDLRANVCPRCGETLSSYFMPKGQDLQAVLNDVFREHALVIEFTFRLARAALATQLVPVQFETWSVAELKARLFADLFARYRLRLSAKQLLLVQQRRPVGERTPLADLDDRGFTLRFANAKLSEATAVEQLRHRIRHRFSGPENQDD